MNLDDVAAVPGWEIIGNEPEGELGLVVPADARQT